MVGWFGLADTSPLYGDESLSVLAKMEGKYYIWLLSVLSNTKLTSEMFKFQPLRTVSEAPDMGISG